MEIIEKGKREPKIKLRDGDRCDWVRSEERNASGGEERFRVWGRKFALASKFVLYRMYYRVEFRASQIKLELSSVTIEPK
jgi:hypothetical protein